VLIVIYILTANRSILLLLSDPARFFSLFDVLELRYLIEDLFGYFQSIWIGGDFDLLRIETPSIPLNPYGLG
jgi:hypothetical protein